MLLMHANESDAKNYYSLCHIIPYIFYLLSL